MTLPPLLRAPPFPWGRADITWPGPRDGTVHDQVIDTHDADTLFARIRAARVGGAFWTAPASLASPHCIIASVRDPASMADLAATGPWPDAASLLWIMPATPATAAQRRTIDHQVARLGGTWRGPIDPWSVLDAAEQVLADGDDEWIALARIAGRPVRILTPGRFGSPGDDDAAIDARVFRALRAIAYCDPFTDEPMTIDAAIALLAEWRRVLDANRPIMAASGMAWWKRSEIRRFLWSPQHPLRLVSQPRRALAAAQHGGGSLAIWPSRVSPALLAEAARRDVPIVRVEDGFLRSVGLGSNLVPPSSIVVDARGIHFDPSGPSDLEVILSDTDFTPELLTRAQALRSAIVDAGISKYAAGPSAALPPRQSGRRLVLVPGQVEDDMSVVAGGGGLSSNIELLRRARALEPDAEIWFRPHPDVDAGHRKGAVPDAEALAIADRIARGPGMAALLDAADAVHVLTSLTGFEALLRGRAVTCHGTPFYAGWGLTRDLGLVPDRRGRQLALDALVAGVLILYPRYLDPVTGLPCPPEVLVKRMAEQQAPNRLAWIAPLRRWQGRFMAAWR